MIGRGWRWEEFVRSKVALARVVLPRLSWVEPNRVRTFLKYDRPTARQLEL